MGSYITDQLTQAPIGITAEQWDEVDRQLTADGVAITAESVEAALAADNLLTVNPVKPEHIFGAVTVEAKRIKPGKDPGLDMWYLLHSNRAAYNSKGQQKIDEMRDWASYNYVHAQKYLRPSPYYTDKMAGSFDLLTSERPGTGESILGYGYGGENWLYGERFQGGGKGAVDFLVAGTAEMLTQFALSPDPTLVRYADPDTNDRMRANARAKGQEVFNKLATPKGSLDEQEAWEYAMQAQGVASLVLGGYELINGMRSLRPPPEFARYGVRSAESISDLANVTTYTDTIGGNTVTWVLDAEGKPISASGVLTETFPSATRSSAELRAQADTAAAGVASDHGGHLVDHRFVLDQGPVNMFPQADEFNLSAYKVLGNDYARYISKGNTVEFTHTLGDFNPQTGRPGSVSIHFDVFDAQGNLVDTFADKFLNNPGQTYVRRAR